MKASVVRPLALLAAVCALAAAPRQAATPAPRLAVIGYLFPQDTLIDPAGLAADKLTHVNYAFANVRDGRVVEGFARDAENFRILTEVRRTHPHLRVLVSVGGWTWSGNFSDAALTAESRQRFVASAVEFVRRHDLDGFDVDWEYPGQRGNGNVHRPEDKENFTTLMAALRAALDADGAARHRRLLLTFAAGVPAGKLVLGVPFYGRGWTNVAATRPIDGAPDTGLYQPGTALTGRSLAYGRLAAELVDREGFVRLWDARAQQPYLWNAASRTVICYDDPESVRVKARYVREHGLGGVMFWEYGDDPGGALLDALDGALRR